jgi:hypothetical protein
LAAYGRGAKDSAGKNEPTCRPYQKKHTFAATFTKTNTEMIRKFALLATTAALMVACGGAQEENMEAKAKAAADSAAKAMEKVAADMKAATTAAADSAIAVGDSAVKAVNAAADEAKDAIKEAAGH